jgi:hypothetical protein
VEVAEGELTPVDRQRRLVLAPRFGEAERRRWYSELLGVAAQRGYQRGWAFHKFKEKFRGEHPPLGDFVPRAPSPEVRSWVKSRTIAWAKSQQKRTGAA